MPGQGSSPTSRRVLIARSDGRRECTAQRARNLGDATSEGPAASSADIKVVQQMLGHHSATMTMDTYGHLFDSRLSEVSEALDAARSSQGVTSKVGVSAPVEGGSGNVMDDERATDNDGLTWENAESDGQSVASVLPEADIIDLEVYRRRGITAGQKAKKDGAPGRIRTYAPASGGRCSIP
jgi:hypothetical protein